MSEAIPKPAPDMAADTTSDMTSVTLTERVPRRRWRGRWRRRLLLGAGFAVFFAAVVTFYVFISSAGTFTSWATWTAYYDPQAEGFRAGHLYTTVPVSPALKALKDPLNLANMRFWRWDYSYYDGHIYLYWGLLPPAILAAVKSVFRIRHLVTDDPLVFGFLLAQAVAGALLIRAMARRLQPRPPVWSVWLAMALFAFAHPTPFLLARGAIYEGAITAGSCFMVMAFYAAFEGLFAAAAGRGTLLLLLASFCTGLAGASRVSLLPAAVATMTVAALARWRVNGGGWPRLLRLAAVLGAPLTAVTLLHMLLNRLRFGEWTEFGQKYQMGFRWFPFGARFLPADLYVYLFRPPTRWCKFPFISAEWGYPKDLFPRWLPVPQEYRVNEPTVGLLLIAPFAWFLWILVGLPLLAWLRRRRAGAGAMPITVDAASADTDIGIRWRWFLAVLVTALCGTAAVPFLVGAATMRYHGDFAAPILLLAVVGAWRWLALFRRSPARFAAAGLFVALALVTIAAGALLGFTGYFNHFSRHNPALLQKLQKYSHVCRGP
jgi:hypothetical protein